MRERAILPRQARNRTGNETDLRPGPVFAVAAVGDPKPEGDIVEAAKLRKVVAKLSDLLPALLGCDFFNRERRQL
jgi:hypothetical protein